MKIMTFNMKNSGIFIGHWKQRTKGFVELIKKEKPDIIGTQEMTYKVKKYLKNLLIENKLFYTFVGESRSRTNGIYDEYNCILINEKINILNAHTYSLSNTPLIPKTKFKGDPFPRIITLIETEKFYFYNTHLTHKITKNKLLQLDCIAKLLKKDKPIIITGDFNLGYNKLKKFINSNNLKDITLNIGKTYSTKRNLFHLDHILINKNIDYKNTIKHNYKYEKRYLSDHYPITSEILL